MSPAFAPGWSKSASKASHERVHILPSVLPIKSLDMAKRMRAGIPGLRIPEELVLRMEKGPDASEVGLRFSVELIEQLRTIPGVHGVHIMAVAWEEAVPRIVKEAGLSAAAGVSARRPASFGCNRPELRGAARRGARLSLPHCRSRASGNRTNGSFAAHRTDTREDTMRTSWLLLLALAISAGLVACNPDEKHLDVTVSWDDTKQTIEGFGASSAFFGGNITDEVADQLFDAKKGIGLSLLRIMIGVPDDTKATAPSRRTTPSRSPPHPS